MDDPQEPEHEHEADHGHDQRDRQQLQLPEIDGRHEPFRLVHGARKAGKHHHGEAFDEEGHGDGTDERRNARGVAQGPVGDAVHQDADGAGREDGHHHGHPPGQEECRGAVKDEIGPQHENVAVGEVQHAEGFVHHRDTDCHQRIQAAVCQTIQYLLKQHLVLPPFLIRKREALVWAAGARQRFSYKICSTKLVVILHNDMLAVLDGDDQQVLVHTAVLIKGGQAGGTLPLGIADVAVQGLAVGVVLAVSNAALDSILDDVHSIVRLRGVLVVAAAVQLVVLLVEFLNLFIGVGSIPDVSLKNVSLREAFFNARHRRVRTPDNVVGRGARRPGDVCSARTEAERRPNPRCLISKRKPSLVRVVVFFFY